MSESGLSHWEELEIENGKLCARIKDLVEAFHPLLTGLVEGGCIVCGFFEEHHNECSVGVAERALAGEVDGG